MIQVSAVGNKLVTQKDTDTNINRVNKTAKAHEKTRKQISTRHKQSK